MKEYDIIFASAVTALGNARSCRLRSLAPEASAVLLASLEADCPPLLLGRPRRIAPDIAPGVTPEERTRLGLPPEGGEDGVEVFCLMRIPDDDPLSAGFDFSHLVLTAPSTGRALEVARPGGVLVPLRPASASASKSDGLQNCMRLNRKTLLKKTLPESCSGGVFLRGVGFRAALFLRYGTVLEAFLCRAEENETILTIRKMQGVAGGTFVSITKEKVHVACRVISVLCRFSGSEYLAPTICINRLFFFEKNRTAGWGGRGLKRRKNNFCVRKRVEG